MEEQKEEFLNWKDKLGSYMKRNFSKTQEVIEKEIISMVNEGQELGVILDSEAQMVSNIFEFADKNAGDIMVHRTNVSAFHADMTIQDAAMKMLNGTFSRYPIYENDLNNIIGIVYFKDIIKYYISDESNEKPIIGLAREAFFVPETISLDILFKELRTKKLHMAIVIDEYGQTAGLVAMEDLLEEIVGDIEDEYDIEQNHIQQLNEHEYLMAGETKLSEIEDILQIQFDTEDYDTLNGYIISKLERIPTPDECVEITFCGYNFVTEIINDKRIITIRVRKE